LPTAERRIAVRAREQIAFGFDAAALEFALAACVDASLESLDEQAITWTVV
jgi:hypothetical protein